MEFFHNATMSILQSEKTYCWWKIKCLCLLDHNGVDVKPGNENWASAVWWLKFLRYILLTLCQQLFSKKILSTIRLCLGAALFFGSHCIFHMQYAEWTIVSTVMGFDRHISYRLTILWMWIISACFFSETIFHLSHKLRSLSIYIQYIRFILINIYYIWFILTVLKILLPWLSYLCLICFLPNRYTK